MADLSVEITDLVIVQKGIDATIEFYATLASDTLKQTEIQAFVTGSDSPFLNVILDARKNPNVSLDQFEFVRNYFSFHAVPWSWFAISAGQNDALQQYGLSLVDRSPAMYFDLTKPISENSFDGFFVDEADENNDLKDWIIPIRDGFPSDDNGEGYRQLNAKLLNQGERKLKHFIARYHGNIVSAATLFIYHDSVMIHNLATKKSYLRRGFATQLSSYLLLYAKKQGYKHCFLDSSVDGFGVYKNLGFKICYFTFIYQRLL
jgi:ribosomal protein S18 acetylase RimI-like enzyme